MSSAVSTTGLAIVTGLLGTLRTTGVSIAGSGTMESIIDVSRDDVIVRLKWIAGIQEGEKLDTRTMSIQPMGMYTSVTRLIRGLNRTQTRTFITSTVQQAVRMIGDDINHITHPSDLPAIERLIQDLENSLKGVSNVKQTYVEDRTFNCALDALSETTSQHLVNFKALVQSKQKTVVV